MNKYIVQTGIRWFYVIGTGWMNRESWLADTTERTSPVVAYTRTRDEAVILSKKEAEEEAKQVNGKAIKLVYTSK